MYKSEQLAHSIRQLIESGTLNAHEKLPSLRDQVQRSGFSLMTVMNAYQELESQGLIYSKEKSGYFVAEQIALKPLEQYSVVSLNSKIEINSLVFKYLKSIQHESVVPFGSAFPDSQLLAAPKLIQIMGQLARQRQSYDQTASLPPGNLALRKLIAQRYCMQGIQTDPDDIVITSGGLDALNLSLQAVAKPGDYILLQQTVFYGAWQAAERLGLKVITIPEHPQHGFDLEAFEQVIHTYPIKVCWLMLNSHNPIGFTVSDEIKYKIAKLLHEHQIYLIEDDVYEELYYGGQKPLSMKCFDQQNALVEFLSHHHYEKHLRTLRLSLERYKKQFYHYLKQHLPTTCEIYYYPSGYFLWVKLPHKLDSRQIYEELIQQDIGVAPSPLFSVLPARQHYLRINCSFEWNEKIQAALDQVIKTIQQRVKASL